MSLPLRMNALCSLLRVLPRWALSGADDGLRSSQFCHPCKHSLSASCADMIEIYCSPCGLRFILYGIRATANAIRILSSRPNEQMRLNKKSILSLRSPSKCSFTISKLRFFGLRKPKTTSFYSTSFCFCMVHCMQARHPSIKRKHLL